ncbi:MAG: flagellar protein FlgN [Planctomycetaceae bacterium]|jgi:flagellar biosynthesis/type III secretory pathway chaperone|nr:flagellar protein FlgN [Planctomycetaceae bacterium]
MTNINWQVELTMFFNELESAQENAMSVLQRKQKSLANANVKEIQTVTEEEKASVERLEVCLKRRETLLEEAAKNKLPSDSIESLCKVLPQNAGLTDRVKKSKHNSRLIQYQSLTNWVITQRSVIHLNQLIELIKNKGKKSPTYNKDKQKTNPNNGGNLVDKVA